MADAIKDQNQIPVMLGISSSDRVTPTLTTVDPITHALRVDDGTTGGSLSVGIASRDKNTVTTMIVASSTDGATPVELYVNSSGKLLINSL